MTIKELRDTEFPIGLRGYGRKAVDRYVTEVNRLITELEMTASPESAVRRALDEVSEETHGLLERAHQTAEQITARSRVKADDRLKQAESEAQGLRQAALHDADGTRAAAQQEADATREAAQREAYELRTSAEHELVKLREAATREVSELREKALREVADLRETAAREAQHARTAAQQEADRLLGSARREAEDLLDAAETRARELSQNAETVWRERRRLVDDVRAIGEQLSSIGEAEIKRFPHLSEAIPPVSVSSRASLARPLGANGGGDAATSPRPSTGEAESRASGAQATPS